MRKLLLGVLALCLCATDAPAQCCGLWQRVSGVTVVEPPPCVAFGCYTGTGANQHINTECGPIDAVWVKRKQIIDPLLGVLYTDAMGPNFSIGSLTSLTYTDEILSTDATGFTVGASAGLETNDNGETYCYYAFEQKTGWMDYGTYLGTGTDGDPLPLDFKPDVFFVWGPATGGTERGPRWRSSAIGSLAGQNTALMDASAADPQGLVGDHIQDFKESPPDAYTGVERGGQINLVGQRYHWLAFKIHNTANWVFVGSTSGTGTAGDDSENVVSVPCATQLRMIMTSNNSTTPPDDLDFKCRFFRNDAVTTAESDYGQQFNAIDETGVGAGEDGGLRAFRTQSFVLANGNGQADSAECNVSGRTYYYWGVCQ